MQNKTLQMKKALRTALLILLLSAAGIANIFSQNQISSFSMYDQKRYELAEKTIEKTLGLMTIPEVQSLMRMYSAAKARSLPNRRKRNVWKPSSWDLQTTIQRIIEQNNSHKVLHPYTMITKNNLLQLKRTRIL